MIAYSVKHYVTAVVRFLIVISLNILYIKPYFTVSSTVFYRARQTKKHIYIYIYIYIYIHSFVYFAHCMLMQFEHSLGLGSESLCRRSIFALYIAHCSHLSTLVIPQCNPSPQCIIVHSVPKFRSCHKAIMVTTGRAHCFTFIHNSSKMVVLQKS